MLAKEQTTAPPKRCGCEFIDAPTLIQHVGDTRVSECLMCGATWASPYDGYSPGEIAWLYQQMIAQGDYGLEWRLRVPATEIR